jgi:predicted nucleotidyltransferase
MRSDLEALLNERLSLAAFPFDRDSIIFAFEGGSAAHGVKLEGKCDTDIFGVFVEPPTSALGLHKFEHFVSSTAPDSERNGPDDVDVALYSLRKFAQLTVKGNPSITHLLFAGQGFIEDRAWLDILTHRSLFLAKSHIGSFLGYAQSQLHRLQGHGTGKHGQREELIAMFAYDPKAAMHMLRLLGEAKELMDTGLITLPRPGPERKLLIDVRLGVYSQTQVERMFSERERLAKEAADASKLPERIDLPAVSELVAGAYIEFWRSRGYI